MTKTAAKDDYPALFARLSAEISLTLALARRLEDAVAEVVSLPLHLPWPAELQHIDQIVQRLVGLTVFCEKLAEQSSTPDIKAALAAVHLHSLVEGLDGKIQPVLPLGGDIDVF